MLGTVFISTIGFVPLKSKPFISHQQFRELSLVSLVSSSPMSLFCVTIMTMSYIYTDG